ncbi:hypothetical protein [Streptomyces sp. NPDC048442]|uniref:hypothetical protein n=1 Tax=Streptomyces sp. NPDC048442 TaxID=3154823 RepID=UPI003426988F
MEQALWIHEARRCGKAAPALPLLAAAAIIAMSLVVGSQDASAGDDAGTGMVRLVASVLPVAVGLAAATAAARDPMVEVQLALPTPYSVTVRRRLTVVTLVSLLAAGICIVGLALAGQWNHPAQGPTALLVPMGPSVLLIGAAAWAQAKMRSTAAASSVVLGVWLLQVMWLDRFISSWIVNRSLLLALGVAMALLAVHALKDSERQLAGSAS